MIDRYCEQCGCAIYSLEDLGASWVTVTPHKVRTLKLPATEERHIICIYCIEEAERDTLNSLTIADMNYD